MGRKNYLPPPHLPLSLSLWFPGSLQMRPSMYLMLWNFNELDIGCPPQKRIFFFQKLGSTPEKNIAKNPKILKNLSFSSGKEKYCLNTLYT
jgi:hypothetical protein